MMNDGQSSELLACRSLGKALQMLWKRGNEHTPWFLTSEIKKKTKCSGNYKLGQYKGTPKY